MEGREGQGSRTPDSPVMAGSWPDLPSFGMDGVSTPFCPGGSELRSQAELLGAKLRAVKRAQGEEAASSSAGSQRAAAAPAAPAAPAQAPIQGHGSAPISVGTVGHPETCGSACRYVKRKGGCREGTLCLSCHLCFWVRDKEPAAGKAKPEAASRRQMPISSQGTVGHPLNCASPCLAAWSSGGCRAGSMCTKCHRCPPIATHVDLDTVGSRRASFTASSDYSALGDFQSSQVETSVGSAGHPVACNAPCKYAHKLRGCKDGRHCTRCHICRWHKPGPSQLPATRWEPAGFVVDEPESVGPEIRL
ncbi:unnamed protein product [Effrenium voratum]|uniref:C3H1-type domain-containing protein n=1 Tax=Effrenium voratum TaxID=2562239 RepID=A0AA36J0L2_9DINO|nr:unnamed protein product [Effrenium voratum]